MKLAIVTPFIVTAALWGQISPGQISITSITTSPTQAVIAYTSPVAGACTFRIADMNRGITITTATQTTGTVTLETAEPHGLLPGAIVYLEHSGWNGWQTITSVPGPSSLVFASTANGGVSSGNIGVLVDDMNPTLFAGADQDSRPGNVSSAAAGVTRSFVVGLPRSEKAQDGNKYVRALQAYSRHHLSITCGAQTLDQDFETGNISAGDTHGQGPPADIDNAGQYAYPTIQWANQAQTLLDPLTGLRSKRTTGPLGTPSGPQTFVTALSTGAWQNPSAALANTGATASFPGPCAFSVCPLFLRADNLSIFGGPTYTASSGNSLDWVTVTTQASVSGQCGGDDCKIVACLTVNGMSCTSGNIETSLSSRLATYTFGTGDLMDLWQGSGAPQLNRVDVSVASGTVNYSSATKQLSLMSGNVFNTRWGPGSMIAVDGTQYSIASIQNGQFLTLASGPSSDLSGASYSANNFGVLIWKKTTSQNAISIGSTTYEYGSSAMPGWSAEALNNCSSVVPAAGLPGYNCFIGSELYWLAADGSDVRDLGLVAFSYYGTGEWSQGAACGASGQPNQFDPQNPDIWYCMANPFFDPLQLSVVQAHYMGPHTQYTPGQQIPDCATTTGVQPCIQFTRMQPSGTGIIATGPPFNPDLAAAGFVPGYYWFGGISSDGDMLIYVNAGSQDTLGWLFIYTLGDRTPTGTTSNSFRIIASASTYRRAPLSWCTIHNIATPDSGWVGVISNDYSYDGPSGTYTVTMTSPALNAMPNAPGGPGPCPPNPLGVTGNVCTTITVAGEPTRQTDGTSLQDIQVGDVMQTVGTEYLRSLLLPSPNQIVVQRGYTSSITTPNASTLTMACGTRDSYNGKFGLWAYRLDPYGRNLDNATIGSDPSFDNGHSYIGGGVYVSAASHDTLGDALCPVSYGGSCYQVRTGDLATAATGPSMAVAANPPFAGHVGYGATNTVDSHPGTCDDGVCLDARPLVGGGVSYPSTAATLGSSTSPFVHVSGQLWMLRGAQSQLHRMLLNTFAYVGRWPLVDISGPSSKITDTSQDSYEYCYVEAPGECVPGSVVGDVYLNAPYVDDPYCKYLGIAQPTDDTLSICIGDIGANTGNIVQFATGATDLTGAAVRRLGPNYAKWNQFDVFWNGLLAPNAAFMGTQVRWLDSVRTDNIITVLPPFPASNGHQANTFVPLSVTVKPPPPGLGITSAVVEFGYSDWGPATGYFCTSRRDACVSSPNINTGAPYSFASLPYSPVPCGAGGCTITAQVLEGHPVYYRVRYINSSGAVVDFGAPQVTLIP